ncbi:MAG: ABC transporter ATP-binding protein [Actinoallomurus sp.]
MMTVLGVSAAMVRYGGIAAIDDVSFRHEDGGVIGLIGPNGAGKTTLLRTIAGLARPWRGRIHLNGTDITRWPAERRARAGLALVPEGRRVFTGLTVEENLRLGAFFRARAAIAESLTAVYELFPKLADRRRQAAGMMSGGEQQMLAIGRTIQCIALHQPRPLAVGAPAGNLRGQPPARQVSGVFRPHPHGDLAEALKRAEEHVGFVADWYARAALAACRVVLAGQTITARQLEAATLHRGLHRPVEDEQEPATGPAWRAQYRPELPGKRVDVHDVSPYRRTRMNMCLYDSTAAIPANTTTLRVVVHRIARSAQPD